MNDLYLPELNNASLTGEKKIKKLKILLSITLTILLVAAVVRVFVNWSHAQALATYTTALQERSVLIAQAKPGQLQTNIILPSSLHGNTEAIIYSRATGYVAEWRKGIGDTVKKGDLLAILEAPEQEQELAQARAQYEQINARLDLSKQTLARWETLQQRQSAISQQDLDEKRSLVRQGQADLLAAQANVKRLEQLQSFRRITAPFNGIITRRTIEVGDLIASTGKELFSIAQVDPLRLTIWIPQTYATSVKVGNQTDVLLKERAGKSVTAIVERVSGGIDPQNRARQVDLSLSNPDGKLLPGAYVEVKISLSNQVKALVVPASVLISGDQGSRVLVVDAEDKIHFNSVKLGRDLGREIEILEGIKITDRLVVSPSDQLVDGEKVKTVAWQPASTNAKAAENTKTADAKISNEEKKLADRVGADKGEQSKIQSEQKANRQ